MWTSRRTALSRLQWALIARADRLAGVVTRSQPVHAGQSAVEWALLTSGLALGLVAVIAALTGALNEYFTALAEWLRAHKPV